MAAFSIDDAVTAILRPQESVNFILQSRAPYSAQSPVNNNTIRDIRQVIAVVTHTVDEREQGALFILKWKRTQPPSLLLTATLPISPDLDIQATQVSIPRELEDDVGTAPSRFSFLVHIVSDGQEVSFVCDDSETLSGFLAECKRLKAIEPKVEDEPAERSHAWLTAYSHRTSYGHELPSLQHRRDLRDIYRGPKLSDAHAGSPGDEAMDSVLIEDEWVWNQIDSKREEYTAKRDILIRVGNFNVNGRIPSGDISSWVRGHADQDDPDILIFGFQEVDLSAGALLYSTSTVLEEAWTKAIFEALGNKANTFVKFASKQLVGMLIIALVRKGQRVYVSDISTASLGIGIMGVLGNKGGVGLRFKFRDTVLCFVASHLAAFDNQVEKRNADYLAICRGLIFPLNGNGSAQAANVETGVVRTVAESIFESDVVFWLGDLNYRIDLPDEEVREMLGTELLPHNREPLMEYDQLKHSIRAEKCFQLFKEAEINFKPTYRFEVGITGTEDYDWKRRPAWTDRILHLAWPGDSVRQLTYESHPSITMSDHKPISANFFLTVRSIDKEQQTSIINDILKNLKGFDQPNKNKPKLNLSAKAVDFGNISYRNKARRSFTITNPNEVAVAFRFLPEEEEGSSVSAPWLKLDRTHGIVLGKETITINLEVFVDNKIATVLYEGAKLENTLTLHLEHGLDYFIAVSGTFLPTCFGRSLESLIHLPGSARDSAGKPPLPAHKPLSTARELMRIVEWLMVHPLTENPDELFFSETQPELLAVIRECLDSGAEFPFFDGGHSKTPTSPLLERFPFWRKTTSSNEYDDRKVTLAFGEILIEFLDSLNGSLVPTSLFPEIATRQGENLSEILDSMPHATANAWVSLTAYLQFASMQPSESPLPRSEIVAAKFAPILMKDDLFSIPAVLTPLQKRKFLLSFLE